jgi:hypothetical protein
MYLNKFFESNTGRYMMSIILGLGLASLFRTVCKEKNCLLFKAPPLENIEGKVFQFDDQCYRYRPVAARCDAGKQIIDA